ncbi:MAG: hypothetical protein KKD33_03105, partial [Verrucomicrobia bacterium]|nr:hypothetical protein [Verrucomicrobiota bacterium]
LPEQLLAGPGPIKPSEVVSGRLRYTTFVHWGHTPAPLLLEGELEFKQDVKMHPTQNPIPIGAIVPGDAKIGYRTVAVQRTGEQDRIYSIFYDKRDAQHVVGHLPYGGYIWYFPSMFGPMGVISLTDGMNYRLSHSERYNSISLSLGEPGQSFKKGDIVKWKYLAVASGFNDYSGIDTPERIIDLMGIDGSPGYDVEAVDGEVTDSRYMLTLKVGKDGAGFRGAIKPHKEVRRLGLPVALPLVLEGANNRWTAVLWDQGKKAMRPIPVAEGKAYAHFKELKRDRSIFMGHPFVCDDREIVLTVVQTGPKSLYLNVHNPTDVEKKVTIRRAAHFDAIPGIDKEKAMWTWVLAPGGEKHVNLGPKTVWTPVS